MVKEKVGALAWLRKQLATADKDLLREMVKTIAEMLMGAEADSVCGAAYRRASPSARTSATATGNAAGTRVWERLTWRSRACARGATSPTGCCSRAGARNGRWWRW